MSFSSTSSRHKTLKSSARDSSSKTTSSLIPSILQSYSSLPSNTNPNNLDSTNTSTSLISGPRPAIEPKKNSSFERDYLVPVSDSTIKSALSVMSKLPLSWIIDESTIASHSPARAAHHSASNTETLSPSESPGERFRRALFYYRYPSSVPLNISSPTALVTGQSMDESFYSKSNPFMVEIRKSWSHALEGAAKMVLSSLNNSFTMYTRQFALFVVNTPNGPVACINRTNLTFRRKLTSAGIQFTLPQANIPTSAPSEDESPISISEQASIDDTPESLVLISGSSSIMQCIAFFVDCYQTDSKWLGICPTIVSYFPFLYGSLCRLECSIASSKLVTETGFENVHTASLSGLITPEAFVELCLALKSNLSESESFKLSCNTISQTLWSGSITEPLESKGETEQESAIVSSTVLACITGVTILPTKLIYNYNIKY